MKKIQPQTFTPHHFHQRGGSLRHPSTSYATYAMLREMRTQNQNNCQINVAHDNNAAHDHIIMTITIRIE